MPATPAIDLATHLATALGMTLGVDLFHGPVRGSDNTGSIPSRAIFVMPNGGPAPDPLNGSNDVIAYADCLVRVRSNPRDYADGLTLAQNARYAIHFANIVGGSTSYISVWALDSQPVQLGMTEKGESEWSISARLTYQETE